MIRLFVSDDLKADTKISVSEAQRHYLLNVMRCRMGENVSLFNGRDGEWLGEIFELNKKAGTIALIRQTRLQKKEGTCILCPALIKKENFDWVLQKATELGVGEIWPIITDRTVVGKLNQERAEAIITEACEQCERLTVPILKQPQKLEAALKSLDKAVQAVCLAERGQHTGKPVADKTYAFFVGPEGGWTPKELALFERGKALFWHIGDTILRAETASVAALACYQFGLK